MNLLRQILKKSHKKYCDQQEDIDINYYLLFSSYLIAVNMEFKGDLSPISDEIAQCSKLIFNIYYGDFVEANKMCRHKLTSHRDFINLFEHKVGLTVSKLLNVCEPRLNLLIHKHTEIIKKMEEQEQVYFNIKNRFFGGIYDGKWRD